MNPILFAVLLVSGIGLVLGIGLTVASVLLSVPVSEKTVKLRECLPGANCGACGFSGCDGYAEALSKGEAAPNLCAPGGAATAAALAEICGVEASFEKREAFVHCAGDCERCDSKLNYKGLESCAAAAALFGGPGSCTFGCVGFGDCVKVCDYDAIAVIDGLARVNPLLCAGCGQCAAVCPKGIIEVLPAERGAAVRCSNTDKGAAANKVCKVSCIGCHMCEKKCPADAIHVEDNLARVDLEKCTGCGTCASVCPRKCIEHTEFGPVVKTA